MTAQSPGDGTAVAVAEPAARPTQRRALARASLLALAVAVLVGGAVAVGRDGGDVAADAARRVSALYAPGGAERALGLLVPGSVPQGDEQSVATALQQVLADESVTVDDSRVVSIAGARIARVMTSDGLAWCVRSDGRLLLRCRVGEIPLTAAAPDLSLQVPFAAGDLYLDGAQLAIALTTISGSYDLDGTLGVETAEGEPAPVDLRAASYVTAGEIVDAPASDLQLTRDRLLLLRFEAPSATARDRLLALGLRLSWDGGALPVNVGDPRWFVR